MPNHVTNVISAPKEVIDALAGPDRAVDFNSIIPEPENIEKSACSGYHADGVTCWYEWNRAAWGTKWNAYDIEKRSETEIKFETAWTHPFPVIQALSVKFPEVPILVKFADEDLGANLGWYTITNGEESDWDDMVEGSTEAQEWACQLSHGCSTAEWYED